jgi:hypothetical protein
VTLYLKFTDGNQRSFLRSFVTDCGTPEAVGVRAVEHDLIGLIPRPFPLKAHAGKHAQTVVESVELRHPVRGICIFQRGVVVLEIVLPEMTADKSR